MPTMRLYSGPLSMFGAKAQIAALEKGLDVELTMVPFTDNHRYQPKHPDVVRINPKQQVPVLIHGDVEIFDSTQIFEYFEDLKPDPALWPRDPAARARARLAEHKADEVYFPHVIRLMGVQHALTEPTAVAALSAAAAYYADLEATLSQGPFLTGPTMTYADIAFYMAQVFGDRMGAPITAATPRLLRWREAMTVRPGVRTVVGALAQHLATTGRPVPVWLRSTLPDGA